MMKTVDSQFMRDRVVMPSLQIRELPGDVYEALAYRAERNGRSLAQQAIVELRRAQEIDRRERRREVLDQVKDRLARDGVRKVERSPEEMIREDRNR
jgi:plasmid stability protein